MISKLKKLWLWIALAPFAFACSTLPENIEFPTVVEAATAATNLTDAALAAALATATPSKADLLSVWEPRVVVVERVRAAIKTGKDLCPSLRDLQSISLVIRCTECSRVTKVAVAQCR